MANQFWTIKTGQNTRDFDFKSPFNALDMISDKIKPGQKYGKLTILKKVIKKPARSSLLYCECECGTRKNIAIYQWGRQISCGCMRGVDHGLSKTRTHQLWRAMLSRCSGSQASQRNRRSYFLRGITVCKRWGKFTNFLADMGHAPDGLTLERIDNNKGYSPSNCRWATWDEQKRNTTRNKLITFQGQTLCASDWARKIGVDPMLIIGRLYKKIRPPELFFVGDLRTRNAPAISRK